MRKSIVANKNITKGKEIKMKDVSVKSTCGYDKYHISPEKYYDYFDTSIEPRAKVYAIESISKDEPLTFLNTSYTLDDHIYI